MSIKRFNYLTNYVRHNRYNFIINIICNNIVIRFVKLKLN